MPKKGKGRGRGRGTLSQEQQGASTSQYHPGHEHPIQKVSHEPQRKGRGAPPPYSTARSPSEAGASTSQFEPSHYESKEHVKPRSSKQKFTEVSSSEVGAVSTALATVSLEHPSSISAVSHPSSNLKRARRPGYSTSYKKKITVVSNFFKLSCNKEFVYHYDVNIQPLDWTAKSKGETPKPLGKDFSRLVFHEWISKMTNSEKYSPVYDGQKNLFTCDPLPFRDEKEFEVSIDIRGKNRRFSIAIKPVKKQKTNNNKIDLKSLTEYTSGKTEVIPQEIRMVYETILSFRTPNFPQVNVRNAFFSTRSVDGRVPLGGGCELWLGYNQTVRFTEVGAAVVINVAAAAFYQSGSVIQFASDIIRRRIGNDTILNQKDHGKISAGLKNIRICVSHQKHSRKYYIDCLGNKSAREQMFDMEENGRTVSKSVEQYFLQQYKLRLRYVNLPCLQMRSGKGKGVFLPMEVCEVVPGQRVQGKLDSQKAAAMIKKAAIRPDERFRRIEQHAQEVKSISSQALKSYGLEMAFRPIELEARILEQPYIHYSGRECRVGEQGVWDMRRQHFESPARVDRWVLISFANPEYCDQKTLQYFAELLCRTGTKIGMKIGQPYEVGYCGRRTVENVIKNACDDGATLVVCVMSLHDNYHSYEAVKFYGDFKYGVVTQCVSDSLITGEKLDERIATNLCLKINTKLGGVNHIISQWPLVLTQEGVMLFGADVVHHVGSRCPSIAAVVGCVDNAVSKYAVSCRVQSNPKVSKASQEIILDLGSMVKSLLKAYYRNTRRKPEKILFYRDGVSEGQFQQVLEKEIPLIKSACSSLEEGYQPPITFIIVQKRHQMRFYPKRRDQGVGRAGNLPPGTAIDTVVVDPVLYDFYLCSHEGIQGTSKPAHYTVLFDENCVKPEVIESVTYYLCHVFARCNRSISIPAPVKYADLLCYRASSYITEKLKQVPISRQYNAEEYEVPEEIKEIVKQIEQIKNTMFFI